MEKNENRTKLLSCLVIVRNSLAKGNQEVTSAMKETKLAKDKTFDKIYAMMLNNCFKKITEAEIAEV